MPALDYRRHAAAVGDDVYLSFTVPDTNADGQKPADIGEVEVYAVTSATAPATENQREVATLIATLPVRPILPAPPAPADGSPPPPIPLPPGVDRGAAVAVKETLTPEARVAVELPVDRLIARPVNRPLKRRRPLVPLVAPAPTALPRRHYFVIAKSPRGRESAPSTPVSVPLEAGSSAPGAPVVTNTASEMTITWPPSPDARTSTFLLPPSVKPTRGRERDAVEHHAAGPAGADREVARLQQPADHVSRLRRDAARDAGRAAIPYRDQRCRRRLRRRRFAGTEFVIKGVTFGAERCFEVRPVDQVFGATVIGPASPRTCFTPKDTFPPAAPQVAGRDRRRRRDQPDLGCERRSRSGRLHRVARRSAR